MAQVVKKKKKGLSGVSRGAGGSAVEQSPARPKYVEKRPPCTDNCPNYNDIREMLMTLSKAEGLGKSKDQATEEAFYIFLKTTPFPSVCGRVCPHPCETGCNRNEKEGAVGINKLERYIGDFGLKNNLKPKKITEDKRSEKIAIVGGGPGGLSCAYHLALRGYQVTVFESLPKAGGMLRYGIPYYRLPADILDAEINRIVDLGVELKTNTRIGKDISFDSLKKDYNAVFLAIGAHRGKPMRVNGEDAANVFTGAEFLNKINSGEKVEVGDNVVVVGGGDTAIDCARIVRRLGASSTLLYRRTRDEMPAVKEEIHGAEEEDVKIEFLAAPMEIISQNGKAVGMKCQRMVLGEPDESGRRRPVAKEGDTFEVNFSTLIAAISQEPNFQGFESLIDGKDWIKVDGKQKTKDDSTFSGGDNINLGLVIDAIAHGRRAAYSIHEQITSEASIDMVPQLGIIKFDKMQLDYYEDKQPAKLPEIPVAERFEHIDKEIALTLAQDIAVAEATRCMSCGKCFDCGTCWSFCQDGVFVKPPIKAPYGATYKMKLDVCKGCNKCADNCPCGYLEMHMPY
jgi:NADPH-dependent glutamate synthase beta subunit-like oxidoreductase/Pyruvate/2-oxoacid:ferredoxin oxidoreductase delta subunit